MSLEISEDLIQFIALHVQSLEQLDILCLLAEHAPKLLNVHGIYERIQTNEQSIAERLKKFVSTQLVIDEDGRFGLSPNYQAIVTELAEVYTQRRVSVIELIYKKSVPSSLRDFSEAFRLKKKE